jgi:3-oxoacyl-(acyl-carrier-protein) synthase
VLITGIGVVLPGATSLDQLIKLVDGGVRLQRDTGPIPEEAYQHLVSARRTRRMSEYAKLTVAAATAACGDAGLEPGSPALAGAAAVLGTTQGSTNFCEAYYGQIVREGLAAANPALFAEGVPNAAAAHLSMTLGVRGPCQTIIGSRRAGLDALALAASRLVEGRWQRAIVSAAEEHSELVARAYEACGFGRPVTGAGAVAVLLESEDAAAARGARVHGWLRAWGWHHAAFRLDIPGSISVAASLGGLPGDVQVAADCARRLTNVFGPLPELFSAGPLAALAYAVARGEDAVHVVAPGARGGLTWVCASGPPARKPGIL